MQKLGGTGRVDPL